MPPDTGSRSATRRHGLLNGAVWRTQSTDWWVTFETFGRPGLTFLFVVAQMPFLMRHRLPEEGRFDLSGQAAAPPPKLAGRQRFGS